jgi:pimeloyl-ACP methyl ester carboxylesterase
LLYRQTRLFDEFDVRCVRYPQDRANSYEQLAALGEAQLPAEGGVVVAESFGGAVALTLALRRPDLVWRLVLINTFAWFPRGLLIRLLACGGRLMPMRPSPPWSRNLRGRLFFPPRTPQTEQDAWYNLTADVPLWAYGMRAGLIARLDLRPRLAEVAVPTVVFVSSNDLVVPPPAGRLLAKRIPKARLIEKPVGHAALIHPGVDVAQMLEDAAQGIHTAQARRPR